jgi:FtsZ-binding cell division protein ZapB
MLRVIIGTGTLVKPNGKPATNLIVGLQMLTLESGWKTIAQSRTDQTGDFGLKAVGDELLELTVAPCLRLAGGRGDVLAENPAMEVARGKLAVGFARIVRGASDTLTDRLVAAERELRDLKVENEAVLQRAGDAETARVAAERTRHDLAGQVAARDARLRELEAQFENTTQPQPGPLDEASTQEFSRLKLQLLGSEIEVQERTARADTLTARIDGVTSERDALKEELSELRSAEAAAPQIGTLATTIASSLRGIEAEGVELADARITLKGYLAGAGDRFKPFDAAELSRADPSAASEISFGVRPKAAVAGGDSQTMPDVVGLTPASARRILRPLGRRVELVETLGKPIGAITIQNPAAGDDLPREATIRLVVATEPNEEN